MQRWPASTLTTFSEPRVVVIGAGMAGILSAIKLQERGITDITVYEKAEGFGGTWRFNTYPGIACDVPSHLYSYSFAPNSEWSHVFSPGDEILEYLEEVARRHGVEKYVRFDTEVRRLEFTSGTWNISLSDGTTDRADIVIAATGVLHHPRYPEIDGIESFAGPRFHSSSWDHSVKLTGNRIGIIGTGSSSVQIVSQIVDEVGELHLFQRTAQWVLQADNPPIDDEDKERFRQDSSTMKKLREAIGQMFENNFANAVVDANSPQVLMLQQLCETNLETVRDLELREKLRPDYRAACKRLIVSPNFYDAVQRDNVRVVTEQIERIEPEGVRTSDGALHEIDVLVLATGFRVDRFMRPMKVIGRGGVDLDDVWAKRPVAYLSISLPEFPNLFMLNGPNGPVGNFSLIDVSEIQFGYISQLLDLLVDGGTSELSATHEATEQFEASRAEAAKTTIWMTGCRSWYLDDRGIPAVWPWSFVEFRRKMSRPNLAHYELVTR